MNLKTLTIAILAAALLADDASASDEPPPSGYPAPPFDAWVAVDEIYVNPSLGRYWPSIAILRYGDQVRVTRCAPDCNAPDAYAELAPFGAVRLSQLRASARDRRGEFLAGDPEFVWARVLDRVVVARAAPAADAAEVERFRRDDELIFRTDASLAARGWYERPGGGFVAAASLRVLEPSRFAGWHEPPSNFAFVRTDAVLTRPDGTTTPVHRYDRFPVMTVTRTSVIVPDGELPKSAVRLGQRAQRPSRVPEGARWVHVSLDQQILTAYEGDRLAFATLVSTGRRAGSTRAGLFEVRRKITYTQMRGGGQDPYSVEGVPWVLYFDGAIALHGAFWHDGFGGARSHGCVNLAPADARFLFDFAPPELPAGWRSVNPVALGVNTLWVDIAAN